MIESLTPIELEVDFLSVSSYGDHTISTGRVELLAERHGNLPYVGALEEA